MVFWLKLDPGVRHQQISRSTENTGQPVWCYKRVARPLHVLGAHGPPYYIFLMDPPFSRFLGFLRPIKGPYVMCPSFMPVKYLLSQVASSGSPSPHLNPSWLPSWDSKGVGASLTFLRPYADTINTPPLPGAVA